MRSKCLLLSEPKLGNNLWGIENCFAVVTTALKHPPTCFDDGAALASVKNMKKTLGDYSSTLKSFQKFYISTRAKSMDLVQR